MGNEEATRGTCNQDPFRVGDVGDLDFLLSSAEYLAWDSLCGLINQNWPQHAALIDTARRQADADVTAFGGDPETVSEHPAYYGMATMILRGLLTLALGIS